MCITAYNIKVKKKYYKQSIIIMTDSTITIHKNITTAVISEA